MSVSARVKYCLNLLRLGGQCECSETDSILCPQCEQVVVVNISAAVWSMGVVVRTSLSQIIWKVVQPKAFLDSTEQLVQHGLGYPVLAGYLPLKDWLILFS